MDSMKPWLNENETVEVVKEKDRRGKWGTLLLGVGGNYLRKIASINNMFWFTIFSK